MRTVVSIMRARMLVVRMIRMKVSITRMMLSTLRRVMMMVSMMTIKRVLMRTMLRGRSTFSSSGHRSHICPAQA